MGDGRGSGKRSPVLSAALAAVLVVVVAGAVVAASLGSADGTSPPIRPPNITTFIGVVLVVLLVVGGYAFVSLLRTLERGKLRSRYGKTLGDLTTLLVIIGLLIVLFRLLPRNPATAGGDSVGSDAGGATAFPAGGSGSDWLMLAVVAAIAVVIGWRAFRNRAGSDDGGDRRPLIGDVAEVLDDVIARLRAEPDPRRAIIAAYARMEDVFACHHLPRRPSEAPLEFLVRALEQVTATEPARRLTELFERAMFSTEGFDRAGQDGAVDALVAVRDDLRQRGDGAGRVGTAVR